MLNRNKKWPAIKKKDKTEEDEQLIAIAWYPWVENGLSDILYSESGHLLLLLLLICYTQCSKL